MNASKQKLTILHGWGGSRETWQTFIDLAKTTYDVEVIELPCFGDEPCPTDVWGVEEYAEFVKSKIQNEKSKIILLGHSFGGQVATVLTARYPELVDKLILSGAAVIRPKKYIKRGIFYILAKCATIIEYLPCAKSCKEKIKNLFYHIIKSPDFKKTSGIQTNIYKKIIRQDVQSYLKHINTPTLVIWGKQDSYVPLRYGKRIASQIKNSTFEILPHAGHGLHIKQPDIFLHKIKKFIAYLD